MEFSFAVDCDETGKSVFSKVPRENVLYLMARFK